MTINSDFLSFSHSDSLRLGFGFGLIFCCGYRFICRFMVVAVEGCCGGGGDGFTAGWLILRFGCLVFGGGGDGFAAGLGVC